MRASLYVAQRCSFMATTKEKEAISIYMYMGDIGATLLLEPLKNCAAEETSHLHEAE